MKFLIGSISVCTLLMTSVAWAQKVVPGEYLIKFKASSRGAAMVQRKLQGKASLKMSFHGVGVHQIQMKASEASETLESLNADPDVEYIEPNYILEKISSSGEDSEQAQSNGSDDVSASAASTNPSRYSQSSADVGVEQAWGYMNSLAQYSNRIIVAVVDTGLDRNHTVFKNYDGTNSGGTGALWVNTREANGLPGVDDDQNGFVDDINGWNFINNTSNFYDDDGHGTHVAGIVVGAGQNIFTRPLARSRIQIMPLKFLGNGGAGSTANAIKAINYAVINGARVINNSWGGPSYSKALHDAIAYAYANQVLVVSAAGNYASDNDQKPMYPSNYDVPSNISVASITNIESLSSFSNFGATSVNIASPGENIESTMPGNITLRMSGTSMAAPLVAGLAAFAFREAPALTGYQMKHLLQDTSRRANGLGGAVTTGGRVDALYLLQSAKNMVGVSTFQPEYTPMYNGNRSLASESSSGGGGGGGCGLVKEIVRNGPGTGKGSGVPSGTIWVVLGLIAAPFFVIQYLKTLEPKSRRRFERFKMDSEIKVNVAGRELTGHMKTISEGGVSFNADQALEKGGIVTMRIQSPDGHEIIEVQGEVVWSEANQAYGVQFSNAKQGTLAMIRDWSSSLLKA